MSAVSQVQAQNRVARLQDGSVGCHVGLRAGMRLNVSVLRSEKFPGALTREFLHHIGELAASVITLSGIALCIFIRENRTHRLQHSFTNKVLGGNQLQTLVLTANFVIDSNGDLRVNFVKGAGHVHKLCLPQILSMRNGLTRKHPADETPYDSLETSAE